MAMRNYDNQIWKNKRKAEMLRSEFHIYGT